MQTVNEDLSMKAFPVDNRWCVHAYYTVSPYAPDSSDRLLIAGTDIETGVGEVLILDGDGAVLDRFGSSHASAGFYHTGFWQTWSPDAHYVYYQQGTSHEPTVVKRELATGREWSMAGDVEGAPPDGEPLISGLRGMLYAAGYGTGEYNAAVAPVPFQQRDKHGIFSYSFQPDRSELLLSVADILENHPQRDAILAVDKEIQAHLDDPNEGATLMTYCVRWSPNAERFLVFFGNHTVKNMASERREPKLLYIFTARRDLSDMCLALDFSFGKPGVHWSWHPDGEHLVGYGPDPDDESRLCLAQVRYDGTGYRRLSRHASSGHPSISPVDHNLAVTDETGTNPGRVIFIDTRRDEVVKAVELPREYGDTIPRGRNRFRVCHHPVFAADGRKVLVNTLPDARAVLTEIAAPGGRL